jgi:hypothetical protein
MRPMILLAAALSLACATEAAPAFAQRLDAGGRCYDKGGKFAKAEVCKGMKREAASGPAMKAKVAEEKHLYKLDAKKMCRDEKGRMAKKEACKR